MANGVPGPAPQTEKRELFAQLIARGVSVSEACRIVGIHKDTGKHWRHGRTVVRPGGRRYHYPPVVTERKSEISPRFLPAAGVGTREELLAAYAAAGGAFVDPGELRWWELFGTTRWGVICVQQAATHLSGAVRSVELAAIGRRVCEVERDVLELLEPDAVATATRQEFAAVTTSGGPHDRPTADELLEAVQEWVSGLPLDGRDHFLARVTTRVVDVVRREIVLAPTLAARHAERLAALGVESDAELAAQIRSGRDDRIVVRALCDTVIDKLRVADPRKFIVPP